MNALSATQEIECSHVPFRYSRLKAEPRSATKTVVNIRLNEQSSPHSDEVVNYEGIVESGCVSSLINSYKMD